MEIVSKSLKETEDFARKVLEFLERNKKDSGALVLALYGDLGAGKTSFVQILGKLLGIKENIQSPTFLIMKSYKISSSKLSTPNFQLLTHIDAYRIENPKEIVDLGFQNLLKEGGTLVAIEWPEKIKSVIPKDAIAIHFIFVDENTRKIKCEILSTKSLPRRQAGETLNKS